MPSNVIRLKPRVSWVGYASEWRASLGNDHGQGETVEVALRNLTILRAARIARAKTEQIYAQHMQHVKAAAAERA